MAQHFVDARYSTSHVVGRDQYYTFVQLGSGPEASNPLPSTLSFNDAPIYLLSPHFSGRKDELDRIGMVFGMSHGDAPTRCAIFGMPGMGKTQLILQYAKLSYNRQQYSIILWISGATIEKLNQGLAKVLTLIGHPDRDHPEQSIRLTSTRRWLEDSGVNSPLKWLLIVDNIAMEVVDFLKEHLPRTNCSGNILMTTRTEAVAEAVATVAGQRQFVFELRAPDLRQATKQLLDEAGICIGDGSSSSTAEAEALVERVGLLPLAISHAASFAKQSHKNLGDVLALYQSNHIYELISWKDDLSSYEKKSVAITFATQLVELQRQSPVCSNFLTVLSFFDPESIPVNMIVEGAEEWLRQPDDILCQTDDALTHHSKLQSLIALIQSPVYLQLAIQQLQHLSLVGYESTKDISVLRIHDLIRVTIQEYARTEDTQWFHVAVALVCGAYQHVSDPESLTCWARCEMLHPHIQSLTKWDDEHAVGDFELNRVNFGLAKYLRCRGRYSEAETLSVWVLAGREKLLGPEHPETLLAIIELAITFILQEQFNKAESLLEQALTANEKILGAEHPNTLKTVHNLAWTYSLQRRVSEAETLYGRALAGREKLLGPDHQDTLTTVHNLAIIYDKRGEYSEAEKLYRRSLTGTEKLLGPEHAHTLQTAECLAFTYEHQERYIEAEMLHQRALLGKEKVLGPEHPETLLTVHHLAWSYYLQERYTEADTLFCRALAGQERTLGHEQRDTLDTVHDIACCYESQGLYTEAEILYQRALAGKEKVLGPEHQDTLRTVHRLACCYNSRGLYTEAEALYQRALTGREKALGPEHKDTLNTVNCLALSYYKHGRRAEAETLLCHVLAFQERTLGHEHLDTLDTVCDIAWCYQLQQLYTEAEILYQRVLVGREKVLGPEHRDTLSTVHMLAWCYNSRGLYTEAEALYQRALAGREKVLGPEHKDTLKTVHDLAFSYDKQGRCAEAETLFCRVLEG
ncbi:hypothetical protein PILCRDRAFT_804162 [Piloderma croceum F 1598]|uniref:NB-ARC domain-containing protein n=1 Tax=Piloderma croceum (strain F 1598) TaxID=765440 RepID=A0A0C3EW41_PILCF|nr:hypothetical protein PILCRDRAFT_804162 [Piloderma croceum F 1598]